MRTWTLLDRRAAMLTKLGQRGSATREEPGEYEIREINPDTDTDTDPEWCWNRRENEVNELR